MLTETLTSIEHDATKTYRLAWGTHILAYSAIPTVFGRPRPHHHITVDRFDSRGARWMMMLEEVKGAIHPAIGGGNTRLASSRETPLGVPVGAHLLELNGTE